ncbi:hypothetical protein KM176_19325 [Pseudooceanicola sp. CBS1P-1]|nr:MULTISPECIES: glycosyl hydrolase [Pseudooceanicola]MBT9386032.1 hypothetical protein [Pseudooceanicola endophyticus]
MTKTLLRVLGCCSLLGLSAAGAALARAGPPPVPFARVDDRAAQPRFRWWWPGALVTPQELRRELREIAAAGFGGVEIADVYDAVSAPIDPKLYGWGTPAWNRAVAVALDEAARLGMTVDLTLGPHWPSALPSITPDSPAAAQEMVHGQRIVAAGETVSGALPGPILPPSGQTPGNPDVQVRRHLVAVLALRCAQDCTAQGTDPVVLEAQGAQDLTDRVRDGQLSWTAPAGGPWILLAIWHRPTAQRVNMFDMSPGNAPVTDPHAYVVDHFGAQGSRAVTAFWDDRLLTPEVRAGLSRAGHAFFEDSLELKSLQIWTPGVLEAFADRRGHDPRTELPVLLFRTLKSWSAPAQRAFVFRDAALTGQVIHDWDRTLAGLWQRNRLVPLRDWAAGLGMIYRNQGYGGPVDPILSAATTGQPEGESLGFAREHGKFQALRAGRDMGSGGLLSDEMGAFFKGYATEWTRDMLPEINRNFAYGVNQLYLHGYAYDTAPGTGWPGFAPFGAMFSEAWNGKQPTWRHLADISGYLTRTQGILQQGVNRTDLAVLRTGFDIEGGYLADRALADAGYTLGYLSPAVLDLPAARVSGGRLKADGPAYKALIVPLAAQLDDALLDRLEALAGQGLPVILLGPLPVQGEGTALAQRIGALGWPRVADEAALTALLAGRGLRPDAAPRTPVPLRSIHRHGAERDDYYLFNDSDQPLTAQLHLSGEGAPEVLDAWTGAIRDPGPWTATGDGVTVTLHLGPSQTRILRLSGAVDRPHVTEASAEVRTLRPEALMLRAGAPGTVRARLSTGETLSAEVPALPQARRLGPWRLVVDGWTPGATASRTDHVRTDAGTLAALEPWTQIPALAEASGVGVYETTLTLPADWSRQMGARIVIPGHDDTIRITVNAQPLGPVDQLARQIDLGHSLQPGDNVIRIELATPLGNALLAHAPEMFAHLPGGPRQPLKTGLSGPITLQPYVDVTLSR